MSTVVVLGSLNEDLVVEVERAPEPGETVLGSGLRELPGGKGANQAVAAARSGALVRMVGAVGDDEAGRRQVDALRAEGVDVSGVHLVPGPTGRAVVCVTAAGENSIVVVPGANATVGDAQLTTLAEVVGAGEVVVAQLETPAPVVAAALCAARAAGATTVLNAAPMGDLAAFVGLLDVLVVNEGEAAQARRQLGVEAGDELTPDDVAGLAGLAGRLGATVVLTLGARGVAAARGGETWTVPGEVVDVVDTTGAGDAFVGALAAALCAGRPLPDSLRHANQAGALACTTTGARSATSRPAEPGPGDLRD